ncbi:uncharacterized protein LOC142556534 isoform X2 [Primulina tabacum]|uniref:uncharacterized protein LOC142556534 isoform X2 n=1 Tax=Primulina tabacum TaxID=48773 RepID=UPI003F598766
MDQLVLVPSCCGALTLFNSTKGRKGRKRVQWEVIKAPKQPDAKQCGYYVMRFMTQITEEVVTLEGDSLRSIVIFSCLSKIIKSYLATYHFENSLSCVFLLIYFLCVNSSQKRSILWKKLMRCAPSWPNAYRIIFMNRHCNDVLEDAPAEKFIPTSTEDILELICMCKSWL